jgi:hypothetical protein
MSKSTETPVKDLSLDLKNYRTVEQKHEIDAVRAMISTRPDYFWALTESVLDSGFLPTENVIVLRSSTGKMIVREGNRRVAALKLIHGFLNIDDLSDVPDELADRITKVEGQWRKDNQSVPCVIYPATQAHVVAKIVRLAHGKGERAGRDQWNAVARARHNRDENGAAEPALDLLEKYLAQGMNITEDEASRWAGNYYLSVLAEAMKKVAPRLGLSDAPSLALKYPNIKHRGPVEKIIYDIGSERLSFPALRSTQQDVIATYGIPQAATTSTSSGTSTSGAGSGKSTSGKTATGSTAQGATKPKAIATNDPRAVTKALKQFQPLGADRDKVVELKIEATLLKIEKTPLAFCFVLRSMFELSARAYMKDHALSLKKVDKKGNAKDKTLAEQLNEITKHLVGSGAAKDKAMEKALYGASSDLSNPTGILSVTSLNQLVHNQSFSTTPHHIATMFGNVFPLLQAMNS